ncbi:MAG: putative permease [Bacteroidetes bacterium]|nr:MAG: putative permease [Bacteroidota bacterium]
MKTLHRFILRSYFGPFLMTFFISVFVLFMQFLWKWVDELVGKGLDYGTIVNLFFFASLSTVPLALPMAVLLSSLMTFGNLGEHYELAALKSSGLSLNRIMLPLFVFTVIISLLAFLFSNNLLPYTNLKMISKLYDIRSQKPALNIKEGVFYSGIEGYSIRIGSIDKNGTGIHDVMIFDRTDPSGNVGVTIAKNGNMISTADKRYLIISLADGSSYSEVSNQQPNDASHPFMMTHFKEQKVNIDLSGFKMNRTDEDLFKENHQMLNGSQLLAAIDTMNAEIAEDEINFYKALRAAYFNRSLRYWKKIDSTNAEISDSAFTTGFDHKSKMHIYEVASNSASNVKQAISSKINELDAERRAILRFKIEFWRKYSLSVACLIMLFIGAPLGSIIRKGGLGMPMVISVVLFIIFWVLSITGEKMSKEGLIPPELGMWLGCIIFLPLGILLTIIANADSAMFDTDGFMQKLRNFFTRRKKHKQV